MDQEITAADQGNVLLDVVGATNDLVLQATVTAGGNAHLRAGQDVVQDSDTVYVVADGLLLQAGRDVGKDTNAATAIDLRVNTVAAESGLTIDPGSIYLNEDAAGGALSVGTVGNLLDGGTVSGAVAGGSGNGSVDVRTEAGSLSIDQAVTAQGSGNVILVALGGTSDLTLHATVTAADDATVTTADDTVQLLAGRDILQDLDTVYIVADAAAVAGGTLDRHGHRRTGHRPAGQYGGSRIGPDG